MHVALVGAEHQEDLTVRYLRGSLEAAGHEVTQIVFNAADDIERAATLLAATQAPLAGLSLVFTNRAAEFAHLAERARQLGYRGHFTTGGHFAAFNAEALLRDVSAIDSVVVGEGEDAICALAEHLDDLGEVPALVFRARDGGVVRNQAQKKRGDLDALPWPTRRRPYDDYLGLPIANILGSRGCSHHCSFCSITAWHRMCGGARLRMRSPETIAEEMAPLYRDGVRIFNFHDDNFILPNRRLMLERVDRMKRALADHGVGRIAFATKARPDEIDRELLEPMMDLGLFRLFIGIEAGTAEALSQLGRTQRLEDNERALALLNELGVHACFNLLLWNPETTLEDVLLNVEWLREHPDNPMNFSRTEVYAGTPLLAQLQESGRLLGDYWGYDYRVADPRADRALTIAYAAFRERNFGRTSLHHLSMRVDYEYHLVAHFFGEHDELRREVKGFVRAVNLDTCDHLEAIVRGCADGTADPAAFTARVVEAVHRSDARLGLIGKHLLLELARAISPARGARSGPYGRRAAAAALVAALSLGASACSGENDDESSEVSEPPMTPPLAPVQPPLAPTTPTEVMQPTEPTPTAELEAREMPHGDPEAIRGQFNRRAMQHLVDGIRPPRETRVELLVAYDGSVTEITVGAEDLGQDAAARIAEQIGRLVFRGADVVGHRFILTVSASELRTRPRVTKQVPVRALHPDPDDDRWTHVAEAAHNPFLDERNLQLDDPE